MWHDITIEDTEVGTLFRIEGELILMEYFPLTAEEKAEQEEDPQYEPWYADFPGQRQPVRYRLTYSNGDTHTFWAAGFGDLGPVYEAEMIAQHIINERQ